MYADSWAMAARTLDAQSRAKAEARMRPARRRDITTLRKSDLSSAGPRTPVAPALMRRGSLHDRAARSMCAPSVALAADLVRDRDCRLRLTREPRSPCPLIL